MHIKEIIKCIKIIKELARIESTKHEAKEKCEHLGIKIKEAYRDKGVFYLEAFFANLQMEGYAIKEKREDFDKAELSEKKFYSETHEDLYHQLLPLCYLAHLYEKNGQPREHAFKLSCLFNDINKVFSYILQFENNNAEKLLHDACLFDLPPVPEQCTFAFWQKLANQKNNMNCSSFRHLLPHAKAIEELIKSVNEPSKPIHKRDRIKMIKEKKEALRKIKNEYKRVDSNPQQSLESGSRDEKRKALSQEKQAIYLEMAELWLGSYSLKNADKLIIEACYEKYKSAQLSSKANQILVDNGINEKGIEDFFKLIESSSKSHDNDNIPNIEINGHDIDYPHYYIRKLNVSCIEDAAIAASLGKMTHCCQYINGPGHACVQHGLTSAYGGFYVLCRGDINTLSIDDRIVAQAWVWVSKDGALCFDSIETRRSACSDYILDMYYYLAHKLCHDAKYSIKRIVVGLTVDKRLQSHPVSRKEHFVDYEGYHDSNQQFLLADKEMPYIFWKLVASKKLKCMIESSTQYLFKPLFSNSSPLKTNELLKKAISFGISRGYTERDRFFELLNEQGVERIEELTPLIQANVNFFSNLNEGKIDYEAIKQGADINLYNKDNDTPLIMAVKQQDVVNVRKLLSEGADPSIVSAHKTAIFWAAELGYSSIFNEICRHETKRTLSVEELIINLLKPFSSHYFSFFSPNIIHVLLNYPDPKFNQFVLEKLKSIIDASFSANPLLFGDQNCFFVWLFKSPELLKTSLALYTAEERLKIAKSINGLFYSAIQHPKSLRIILNIYPSDERLKIVKNIDRLFYSAIRYPESFCILLELYPENERFKIIKQHINQLNCPALPYTEFPSELLKLCPVAELFDLPIKDELYHSLKQSKWLKSTVRRIPTDNRVEFIKKMYSAGFLDDWQEEIKLFVSVIHLLPEEKRLELLEFIIPAFAPTCSVLSVSVDPKVRRQFLLSQSKESDEKHASMSSVYRGLLKRTPVHEEDGDEDVDGNPGRHVCKSISGKRHSTAELTKKVLALLPKADRFKLVKSRCSFFIQELKETPILVQVIINLLKKVDRLNGFFILFACIVKEPTLLKAILDELIEDTLLHQDNLIESYRTMLYQAAHHPDALKVLLERLPNEKLFDVMTPVSNHDTILHLAALMPDALKILLDALPKERVFEAIKLKNELGGTVLHAATQMRDSLEVLLDRLPKEKLCELISLTSHNHRTVLHEAILVPDSLKVLLDCLPKEKLWELISLTDHNNDTVLHEAAFTPDALKMLLDALPKERLFEAITRMNKSGMRVVHLADCFPDSLMLILTKLAKNERVKFLELSHHDASFILHSLVRYPDLLKELVYALHQEKLFEFLKLTEHDGNTVFHSAAIYQASSLALLLDRLPKEKLFDLMMLTDNNKQTVLHIATRTPDSLRVLLDRLPKEKLFDLITLTDNNKQTVLHIATHAPDALKVLLDRLPKEKLFDLMMLTDNNKQTVLHRAAYTPDALEMLLDRLPKEKLFTVTEDELVNLSTLQWYPQNLIYLFKMLLYRLPENKRFELFLLDMNSKKLILFFFADDPNFLNPLLDRLSTGVLFKLAKDKFVDLIQSSWKPQPFLEPILDRLPEDQLLELVLLELDNHNTVLHAVADNPNLLKFILDRLPKDRLLALAKTTNKEDTPILYTKKEWFFQNFCIVLNALREEDRFRYLKDSDDFIYGTMKAIFNFDIQPFDCLFKKISDTCQLFFANEIDASFAIDYLKINYSLRLEEKQALNHNVGIFKKKTFLSLKRLYRANSFDEIKKMVLLSCKDDIHADEMELLINRLVENERITIDEKLTILEKRWGVSQVEEKSLESSLSTVNQSQFLVNQKKGKQRLSTDINDIVFQLTQRVSLIEIEENEYQNQRNFYGTEPYPLHYEEGDCLFASIAAFMPNETAMSLRKRATQHIEQDEQLKNSIITLINSEALETLRTKEGDKGIKSFFHYVILMSEAETWGTAIEVVALARSLQRPIAILTPQNQYDYIVEEEAYQNHKPIFLNYVGDIHYAPLLVPDNKNAMDILNDIRRAIKERNNERERNIQQNSSSSTIAL